MVTAAEQHPAARGVRLLTLNISGPSTERAGHLAEFMLGLDPDVVVVTETRANPGPGASSASSWTRATRRT